MIQRIEGNSCTWSTTSSSSNSNSSSNNRWIGIGAGNSALYDCGGTINTRTGRNMDCTVVVGGGRGGCGGTGGVVWGYMKDGRGSSRKWK